ncbi:rod shape-determining protein MreD [Gaoshiqia sediminis]|uniref:Rod shape-determining protein MreD n=1 Tax=Gaoshiqia sediminis TaxID=2986998 RepID=A0AA42CAD9_9BACT|nr:rod shape-determining protein MreD [Gaoshiqia sediminis]MCW0483632.1 rod shape-determining protein MreD [Gaoshiqia sediminis]
MSKAIGKYVIMWVVLVLLQVLLLNHIQISGYINPYLYILFILLLPFDTPKYLLLILGFLLGLNVDIFSNTPGIHASATTFLAFIRPAVIRLISSRDVLELNTPPRLGSLGFHWFFKYSLILVLAHHFFLFYVEVFTLKGFIFTFFRSVLSSAFTLVLIIISQYLIYKE